MLPETGLSSIFLVSFDLKSLIFNQIDQLLITFLVLFATTIAFFIFSGAFYSQGAYNITPGTFNLMGVIPHVWAEPIPWLNIFATLAIYLMILLAARFLKYVLFKDVQDEVIFCSEYVSTYRSILKHIFDRYMPKFFIF